MNKFLFYAINLLFLSFIIACQEDLVEEPSPSSQDNEILKKFSLKDARAYFETNATDLSPLLFGKDPYPKVKGISVQNLVPEWEKGMESGHEGVKLIEVPLYSGLVSFSLEKVIKSGKLAFTKNTFTSRRLIIAKRNTGVIEMFVVTIIPSATAGGNIEKSLKNFRYLGGGDFTGHVFASRLDGTFFRAFRYEKGQNKGERGILLKSQIQDTSKLQGDYSTITLMDMMQTRSGNPEEECPHGYTGDDCSICMDEVVVTFCPYCHETNGCICLPCSVCGLLPKDCICSKHEGECPVCHLIPCGCGKYPGTGSGGGGSSSGNSGSSDQDYTESQVCSICGRFPCVCACPFCHSNPCRCCNGETCPYCGGLVVDASQAVGKNCKICRCKFDISISASKSNQILKPYNITVTIKPSPVMITSYRLRIHRTSSTTEEETMYEGNNLTYTRCSHSSGIYDIYAEALFRGTTYKSKVITVEEKFPSVKEIKAAPEVASELAKYWDNTKKFASAAGRKEFGCWIYLDTRTGRYVCEEVQNDNVIVGCVGTNGEINPGRPKGQAGMGAMDVNAYEYVAFFHTHTPLTYCSDGERPTGPSGTDYRVLNQYEIPGLLYDYTQNPLVKGHTLDASAELITFGSNSRRATKLTGN